MSIDLGYKIADKWKHFLVLTLSVLIFYLIPTFSHAISFPLYKYEPMRLILFFVILVSGRRSSYIIAFTLPIFSYLTSSHPSFFKVFPMSVELALNTFLYFELKKRLNNYFVIAFLSIMFSKCIYYLLKYIFISSHLLPPGLVNTPFFTQLLVSLFLSLMVVIISRRKSL